jgi:hypothetical protein
VRRGEWIRYVTEDMDEDALVEEDRGARNVCERETTIPDKSAFSASTRPRRVKRRTFRSRRYSRAGLACGRASPLARASCLHVPSPG